MSNTCVFCSIVRGEAPAAIVCESGQALAFVDLRQFHPGHVLVVSRRHLQDVRELDEEGGAAVMAMLARVTRTVAAAFPQDGLSVWHSIGEAGGQEVPHLHFHVHPRRTGDGMLRVYPRPPELPDATVRECYAERLRRQME